jgi:formimidoylglutamate deiminase
MSALPSVWFKSALLPQGWAQRVRFTFASTGRIASVQTDVAPAAADEQHAIALPGMPNLHSHAFQRAMAGLTEIAGPGEDSFWTWRDLMYRFLEHLGPDEVEAISALAFCEMLEAGFTRVGEFHYLHHDPAGRPYADCSELAQRVMAAAEQTGINLTLLPVFYAHAQFGGVAPQPAQRRFINSPDSFATLFSHCQKTISTLEGAKIGIAPHSLRAVTPQELQQILPLVPIGPIHIHIAEQVREVEDCLAWCAQRPVSWLLEHAAVDARWCLVHATHLTAAEITQLAYSGAVAGLCPITEANLGDGLFPAVEYMQAGGAWGVGSDSNIEINLTAELRLLEYGQRLAVKRRNVLASREQSAVGRFLFESSIKGGAQALGLGTEPIGLAVGAYADVISLDLEQPALQHRREDAVLNSWIFAARDRAIDCVWSRGRKVVQHGWHLQRAAIVARYRPVLQKLIEKST